MTSGFAILPWPHINSPCSVVFGLGQCLDSLLGVEIFRYSHMGFSSLKMLTFGKGLLGAFAQGCFGSLRLGGLDA